MVILWNSILTRAKYLYNAWQQHHVQPVVIIVTPPPPPPPFYNRLNVQIKMAWAFFLAKIDHFFLSHLSSCCVLQ